MTSAVRRHAAGWGPAVLVLLLHLAFARGYGVFRDELYYAACAHHLDWGYVDHPPLSAVVARAVIALAGHSYVALRVVAALAHAATVVLAARLAGRLGGGAFARLLAGLGVALAPIALALGSFYSMNALDLLFWVALADLAAGQLAGGAPRRWLLFGAVAGVGLQNKVSVLFLGSGLLVGLVLARRRDVVGARWIWLGAGVAALLFAPHLAWQHAHGWPTLEFMDNARRFKMVALDPLDFLGEVALQGGASTLLWIPGAAWLCLAGAARPFRPLGLAFLAVLALLVATHGKPYYLAAGLAIPIAGGAVAWERWTAARAGALRPALVVLVVAANAAAAPLARPVLDVDTYVRYADAIGFSASSGERQQLGRLPQQFADMHGWRQLAEDVAEVHRSLPAPERPRACIVGQNYGQAGAVDFFGPELGLPPAISPHNAYWMWGPRGCTGEVVIVIGDELSRLRELFESVELGKVHDCTDCMPYEDGRPIWIARRARRSLAQLWPAIKRFI